MRKYLVCSMIVIAGLVSGCRTGKTAWPAGAAAGETAAAIRAALSTAVTIYPYCEASEFALSEQERAVLGGQYQNCLGQYLDQGSRVVRGLVYDDRQRQLYRAYLICPQAGFLPEAVLYIGSAPDSEPFYYWSGGSRFISNDPAAKELPGFHSAAQEGQLRLEDYSRSLYPDSTLTYEYVGEVGEEDLDALGLSFVYTGSRAFHYRIQPEPPDAAAMTDAYIAYSMAEPFFIYTKTGTMSWKKWLFCNWDAPNGDNWSYSFCQPFSLAEGGCSWEAGLTMTVQKNDRLPETCTFGVLPVK